MANKTWQLIAYDIRRPKRLRRIHYYVKKRALPLQESVFLIHTDPRTLREIEIQLRRLAHPMEDDIRVYPLSDPSSLWMAGRQRHALTGIEETQDSGRRFLKRLLKRLRGRPCC